MNGQKECIKSLTYFIYIKSWIYSGENKYLIQCWFCCFSHLQRI